MRGERTFLLILAVLAFALGAVGTWHGLVPNWNADELGPGALRMGEQGSWLPPDDQYPGFVYYASWAVQRLAFGIEALAGGGPLAGFTHAEVGALAARWLSCALAALAVLAIGIGLREVVATPVRLVAAFAMAFSHGVAGLAHWSTTDVPLFATVTFALVATARWQHRPSAHRLVLAGLAVGLATATKYTGVLVAIAPLWAYVVRVGAPSATGPGRSAAGSPGSQGSSLPPAGQPGSSSWSSIRVPRWPLFLGLPALAIGTALFVPAVGERVLDWAGPPAAKRDVASSMLRIGASVVFLPGFLVVLTALLCRWSAGVRRVVASALHDRTLLTAVVAGVALFLVLNPALFVRPFDFCRDVLQTATTTSRFKTISGGGTTFLSSFYNIVRLDGPAFALFGLLGVPFLFAARKGPLGGFLVFGVLYFFVISSWSRSFVRWTLPLLPVLAVAAGLLVARLTAIRRGALRSALLAIVGLAAVATIAQSVLAPVAFLRDARAGPGRAFLESLPAGTRIGLFDYRTYVPAFPAGLVVEPYVEAFDRFPPDTAAVRATIAAFEASAPDYVVLSWFKNKFLNNPDRFPEHAAFFERLLDGRAGYETARYVKQEAFGTWIPFFRDPEFIVQELVFLRRKR